jgi:hypothetical protein
MFLIVRCQHAPGACQSHSHPVLSLREASRKYIELSPSTLPFLTLQFHEKDLTPTPNLLRIRPILPPLGHILSVAVLVAHHHHCLCCVAVSHRCCHCHCPCHWPLPSPSLLVIAVAISIGNHRPYCRRPLPRVVALAWQEL